MGVEQNKLECLSLTRVFSASIERVFAAWTQPAVLAKWFGPQGYAVIYTTVDLSVDGAYEIVIESPEGQSVRHFGQYLQIIKPTKLVFTWMLDGQPCQGSANQCAETLVTIDFKALGQSTEITLTHEQLPGQQALDGHSFGWNACFDSLQLMLDNK